MCSKSMPTVSKFVWELHLDQFVIYHYKYEKIGIKINVLIKWTSNNIFENIVLLYDMSLIIKNASHAIILVKHSGNFQK